MAHNLPPTTRLIPKAYIVVDKQAPWETGKSSVMPPPPPLVLTRARFLFRVQKCGNTGLPCLDNAVVPCSTYHETHKPTLPLTQPLAQPYTPK